MPNGSGPLLLAYIHLRPGVPDATRLLLHDYIHSYADREGFALGDIFTGIELVDDRAVVRLLVEEIRGRSADAVLITGPSPHAMATVRSLRGVQVLTLADVGTLR